MNADMVRSGNPEMTEAAAHYLADLWNTAYPHMRTHLTDGITACRDILTRRSDAQLAERLGRYEITRRELGQLDRGTHRACTRSAPAFSLFGATCTVRHALEALPIDSPTAGDIYRLIAELSDLRAAAVRGNRKEATR